MHDQSLRIKPGPDLGFALKLGIDLFAGFVWTADGVLLLRKRHLDSIQSPGRPVVFRSKTCALIQDDFSTRFRSLEKESPHFAQ